MGLGTFSSLLEFAVKLENDGLAYYSSVAGGMNPELLSKLKSEAQKNAKSLQTILRENVTEMVMEPFDELPEQRYSFALNASDPVASALEIVEKQRVFLADAAKVINLKEVKRLLEKLADKKEQAKSEIKN